jgi:hypothetical protein
MDINSYKYISKGGHGHHLSFKMKTFGNSLKIAQKIALKKYLGYVFSKDHAAIGYLIHKNENLSIREHD